MLQFTNGFSCAMDQENGELIVNFIQQAPRVDDNGETAEVSVSEVVSLVMGKVMAQKLAESINELLEN